MQFLKLVLILGLLDGTRAFAHAGCSDEPFANRFIEIANAAFKIRPLPAGEPYSYIVMDGERITIDARYEEAVRRQMGDFVESQESEALYAPVGWTEWTRWWAKNAAQEIKHMFSRRFVFSVTGMGVEGFYRFGSIFAPLIVGFELFELAVITPIAPYLHVCQIFYGACAVLAQETQDLVNVATNRYPADASFGRRLGLWRDSHKLRWKIRRALKSVYRVADDVNLSERARRRSYRDFSPGAEILWGNALHPGMYRHTLAVPICEDCDDNRLKRFKYKNFGGSKKPTTPPIPDEIPAIEDFPVGMSLPQRFLRTRSYVQIVRTILEQASLSAGDLTRIREGKDGPRVPLRTTLAKARGYFTLRREVARMHKALDLYSSALTLRAFKETAREEVDGALDRDFAATMSAFIGEYKVRLKQIDALEYGPVARGSVLWKAPKRALENVRDWIRTGQFCEDALVADPA